MHPSKTMSWQQYLSLKISIRFRIRVTPFIISMTKLLDADWLRGVQLFH
jgi:hypothetical protein